MRGNFGCDKHFTFEFSSLCNAVISVFVAISQVIFDFRSPSALIYVLEEPQVLLYMKTNARLQQTGLSSLRNSENRCLAHKSVHTNITNERTPIMTIFKPTTSTPSSPVPKKTVKFAKTAGSAKFGSAAAAEKNSIDAPLQSMNTRRRFARRGSKTPGMLSASASRLVFDCERCSARGRNKLESGVSTAALVNGLRLKTL